MIRVLVWAGSSMTRAGLEGMLRANPDFEIVGANGNPASALEHIQTRQLVLAQIKNFSPDVVVVEAGQVEVVIRAAHWATDGGPGLLLLSDDFTRSQMVSALQGGVRGILPRDSTAVELSAAIEAVAAGLTALHPDDLDLLLPAHRALPPEEDSLPGEPLTEREIEVLGMMAEGLGNKTIAARLNISEHTVKFHVSSILAKLGAASRTEAVTRGVREGLIMI